MVISFKFLQCKRAHPPHLEDVIKIRERRERRDRVMTETIKVYGKSEFTEHGRFLDDSYLDYRFPWEGSIVPQPAHPIYEDPLTHKQFKVPQPNEKDIGDMFKFYGVDLNKTYKCPACDLEGSLRTLLPHLNNTESGFIETVYSPSESTPDKPASGEIMIPSGSSFVGEIHESHNWSFKQLGEWMETLGY